MMFGHLGTTFVRGATTSRCFRYFSMFRLRVLSGCRRHVHRKPILAGSLCAAGVFTSLKHALGIAQLDEDPLKDSIKRSILAMDQQNFLKAESHLHDALKQAVERQDPDAENFVYSAMANMYTLWKDYAKALDVYKYLATRLIQQKGLEYQYSRAFLHLSLKTADVFAALGQAESAETGFKFVLENQLKNIGGKQRLEDAVKNPPQELLPQPHSLDSDPNCVEKEEQNESNEFREDLTLYGMVADSYAHFLIAQKRFKDAIPQFETAVRVSGAVFGLNSRLTILELNNVGSLHLRTGNQALGIEYLREASAAAEKNEQCIDLLPGFLLNYAEALHQTKQNENALEVAKQAKEAAVKYGNKHYIDKAAAFLDLIKLEYAENS